MLVELTANGSLMIFALIGSIIIMGMNIYDSIEVMSKGDVRDKFEKLNKSLAL